MRSFALHIIASLVLVVATDVGMVAKWWAFMVQMLILFSLLSLFDDDEEPLPPIEKPKRKRKAKNGEYVRVSGDDPNVKGVFVFDDPPGPLQWETGEQRIKYFLAKRETNDLL